MKVVKDLVKILAAFKFNEDTVIRIRFPDGNYRDVESIQMSRDYPLTQDAEGWTNGTQYLTLSLGKPVAPRTCWCGQIHHVARKDHQLIDPALDQTT